MLTQKTMLKPAALPVSGVVLLGALAIAGLPGSAHAADLYPVPGEVIFSELMINPATGANANNEWIELYSRATAPVRLDGCLLLEGTAGTCTFNGATVPGHCYTLPTTTARSIAPAGFQVMAFDATQMQNICGLTDVADYSTLSLNNSSAETIDLYCPNNTTGVLEVVSSMTYQWDKTGGLKGHSWMLDQAFFAAGDATSAANWCVAPDTLPACTDSSTGTAVIDYGTPGAISACPVAPTYRYPEPGSVYFNELNIWPTSSTSSPEYIELAVKSAPVIDGEPPVQLNGCMLRAVSCGSLSDETCLAQAAPTFTTSQTLLSGVTETFALTEGSFVLLAKGETGACLSYDPVDPSICLVPSQVGYSTETLFNSSRRLLEFSCPDTNGNQQTIDRVIYDKTQVDADCRQTDERCSWELRLEAADATLNDDTGNWGAAPRSSEYTAAWSNGVPEPAWGTPGAFNQVGPRIYLSPLAEGDLAMTELAIWPGTTSTTPDWLELEVLNAPALDAFDVGSCVLRTFACDNLDAEACLLLTLGDSAWDDTSAITPITQLDGKDDLYAYGGERWLFGASASKTCLAIDEIGACSHYAQGSFSSTVGLSNSETRLLELACPDENNALQTIDRLVYDKVWEDLTCSRDDLHCSWELRPALTNARTSARTSPSASVSVSATAWIDNDDPKNWVASTNPYYTGFINGELDVAHGSPGEVNSAEALPITAGPPTAGSVAFSELMIDPTTGSPEWLELQGVTNGGGGTPYDLAGCQLLEASTVETTDGSGQTTTALEDCSPDAPGGCKVFELPAQLSLPIGADEQRLLVSGDHCLSLDPADPTGATCAIPADLLYNQLSFSTTIEQEVALWCPAIDGSWTNIDRFSFRWSDVSAGCNTDDETALAACSLMVQEDHINTQDNDDPYYRCVADVELASYRGLDGNPVAGNPGQPNLCRPLPTAPQPGDVIFTELMIAPRNFSDASAFTAQEWFELKNLTDTRFDFRACAFTLNPYNPDGTVDETNTRTYSQAQNPAELEGAALQVWAANGCLVSTQDGCGFGNGDNPLDGTMPSDAAYTSLSFSNSSTQRLALVCSGPSGAQWVVDAIKFDFEANHLEEGHSWMLSPDAMTAEDNDNRQNWCMASYQQKFFETDQGCNYGTPGSDNACLGKAPYDGEVGPGCRCDGGDGRVSFSHLGLGLVLAAQLGLLRRRNRKEADVRTG